jgi:hypothetical protein
VTESEIERFYRLFIGLDRAYGKYILEDGLIVTDGEKAKGKGVGIVPIMDGNHVRFAAIDIDDYNLDIPEVLAQIRELRLPLVPTRSKSGGVHLWLFFSHDVPASAAQEKLIEISEKLGFAGVEVFPKQKKISPDGVGNWINLPWFDADAEDGTARYGWDLEGNDIKDLGKWLDYAEQHRLTLKDLDRIRIRGVEVAELPFADGPPCLQALCTQGIQEGTRDTVMFNIGVYAAMKAPDERRDQLGIMYQANAEYFDPPMSDTDLEKCNRPEQDYRFQCNVEPLTSHCDRARCLQRPCGVQMTGEAWHWGTFWHHIPVTSEGEELRRDGHWRIELHWNDEVHMLDGLSFEDVMTYRTLRGIASEMLHRLIPMIDNADWNVIVDTHLPLAETVHEPEDASSVGELRNHISQFLNHYGSRTESKQEVLHGKAWLSDEDDDECFWFKSEALLSYLKTQRYTDYQGTRLSSLLRSQFGFRTDVRRRIGGEASRLWTCPVKLRLGLQEVEDGDVPDPESTF